MLGIGNGYLDKVMKGSTEVVKVMKGTTPIYAKVYVTFVENGGSDVANKYVYFGQLYGTLPSPTRSGYSFGSWWTTIDFQFGTTATSGKRVDIYSDHSLYASWLFAPQAPTITYVSKTHNSISFTVTNNAPYSLNIYYEHTDSTPDAAYVTVASGATSSTLTVTGLSANTSYTVYAQANKDGYTSSVVSITQTTLTTPVWTTVAGTTYDNTVTVFSETTQSGTITALLTTNYPPANYAIGYRMRVYIRNSEMTLIGTTYRIRA